LGDAVAVFRCAEVEITKKKKNAKARVNLLQIDGNISARGYFGNVIP
jgi:hypothetical protein